MRGAPLPEKEGPGRYDRAAWSLTLRPGSDCSPRQQDDTGKQNPQPAALLQYPYPPLPTPQPRLRGCPGRSDSWVHAARGVRDQLCPQQRLVPGHRWEGPARWQVRHICAPFTHGHSGEGCVSGPSCGCKEPDSLDLFFLCRCSSCFTAAVKSVSPSSLWSGRRRRAEAAPGMNPSGPRRCASASPCTPAPPLGCSAPACRAAAAELCTLGRSWCCRMPARTHTAPAAGFRSTRCSSTRRASSVRNTATRSASTRGSSGAATWDTVSKVSRSPGGTSFLWRITTVLYHLSVFKTIFFHLFVFSVFFEYSQQIKFLISQFDPRN